MAIEYLTVEHLTLKQISRIFSQVSINRSVQWNGTPCWLWTGYTRRAGYARVRLNYAYIYFHRLLYAWLVGPLPANWTEYQLDHLCQRPSCGNPVHLELVTPLINTRRTDRANKTHCKYGHCFSPDNTYITPQGERDCRICRRANKRRNRAKRRLANLPYT